MSLYYRSLPVKVIIKYGGNVSNLQRNSGTLVGVLMRFAGTTLIFVGRHIFHQRPVFLNWVTPLLVGSGKCTSYKSRTWFTNLNTTGTGAV